MKLQVINLGGTFYVIRYLLIVGVEVGSGSAPDPNVNGFQSEPLNAARLMFGRLSLFLVQYSLFGVCRT